eukprot:794340-Heterocapsa_arctica.AAC.1
MHFNDAAGRFTDLQMTPGLCLGVASCTSMTPAPRLGARFADRLKVKFHFPFKPSSGLIFVSRQLS